MLIFIAHRLLYAVPTLLGISLLTFTMLQLVPGDVTRYLGGEEATEEQIQAARRELGLDRPAPVQYAAFLAGIVRGDLGISYVTREPVAQTIARRYPRTLTLATAGILFSLLIGVTLGALGALRPYSLLDTLALVIAVLGMSIPGFWLGLMLIYIFSVELRWLPMLGLAGPEYLILPTITISSYAIALIARMTRANLIEAMENDYIRTARAKGLRERAVIVRHALKNALMPVVTMAGLSYGHMLGLAVIVEVIFSIDGTGRMIVEAVFARDTGTVQAGVMVVALNFVLIGVVLDVVHAYLDPRLRK